METEKILKKHGILIPDEKIINLKYVVRRDDWYIETAKGWFWYDVKSKKWVAAPMGPL